MPARTIFLIRHGETDTARLGLYGGLRDEPLNAAGRAQAARLAARFAAARWGTVHTSTLSRARATAAPLAASAGGARVEEHAALREMDYGDWTGLGIEEVARRWPEAYAMWRARDPALVIPGGESARDFMARVTAKVAALRESADGDLVVVAHGGSVKAALADLLAIPMGTAGDFLVDFTGVTMVSLHGKRPALRCFNDTGHLEEDGRWWRA